MHTNALRRGSRALVLIGSIVAVVTLGFVSSASASTTLGNAQSQGGLNCTPFPPGNTWDLVQQTSSVASYTVPSDGTLTNWSIQEGDFDTTVALDVWRPSGSGFELVFMSPTVSLNAGNSVIATPLAPPAQVQAGDILGLHIADAPGPCLYSGDPGDVVGAYFETPALNTPQPPPFDLSFFGDFDVNVAANFVPTPPVRFVTGNARNVNPNNNITATVGADGVAKDDTVVVSVATGTFNGAIGCHDTEGNTYVPVADRNGGSGRLFVCASTLTTALSSGDIITATYPGFSGLSVMSVDAISASVTTGALDGTPSTASGSNPPVNSGNITTTHAPDVLFAAVAHSNVSTFSAGAGYTVVGEFSGGSGAGKRTVSPMFQIVNSTGTFNATGTLSGSGFWQAALIGFQGP